MASNPTRDKWKAAGLCGQCGRKPSPGRKCCPRCIAKQQARDAAKRTTPIVGKWRPGGPGRPPVWARVKGGAAMEPQCQPSNMPMRAEHQWDDEVGACVRCGKLRPAGFVATAAPESEPLPVVQPSARQVPIASAADKLTRSSGPRGTVAPLSREQKLRFQGGMGAVPAREPLTPGAPPFAGPADAPPEGFGALPLEADVATYPDPIVAVIAQLELELVETELVLDVLRRIHTRRKTA
jgi:hypothetical protein